MCDYLNFYTSFKEIKPNSPHPSPPHESFNANLVGYNHYLSLIIVIECTYIHKRTNNKIFCFFRIV